jgi:hypothetical protein
LDGDTDVHNKDTGQVDYHFRLNMAHSKMQAIPITADLTLENSLAGPFTRQLSIDKRTQFSPSPSARPYQGEGSMDDPYIVDWLPGEPANPLNWKRSFRWLVTLHLAVNCLCPVFASSSYVGAVEGIIVHFPGTSEEVGILGLSLYVLGEPLLTAAKLNMSGQAFGPLLWAPLSEIVGRRVSFLIAFPVFVLFNLAGAVAQNLATIMVTRFFAGVFGAGQLAVIGGQMADLWEM